MIFIGGNEVNFKIFPNKEKIITLDFEIDTEYPITIEFYYDSDEDIMNLFWLRKFLEEKFPNQKINLIIRYMPYSRMDRPSTEFGFALKYITDLINSLNFTNIFVLTPHSEVTCQLLNRCRTIDILRSLLDEAVSGIEGDYYLVFPDEGCYRQHRNLASEDNPSETVIIGNKERDFATGKITSIAVTGDFKPHIKQAIIVDDLCSKGGTFIGISQKLIEKGVTSIILAVAHTEETIFEGKIPESEFIKKIYTTDSIIYKNRGIEKIEIVHHV